MARVRDRQDATSPQVRVDRKRKQSAIVFLMAIGMTKSEIAQAFKDYPLVLDALEKETLETQDEALTDLYRKIRPADTPTPEAGKNLLDSFYFNTKRYDLARVGRYKINRKLGLEKGRQRPLPPPAKTSSPRSSTWWPCTTVRRPSRASATARR
ncbi:MAG: hypothetical protein ACLUAM_10345 [Bifidobacterium adolescentis]